MIRVEHIEVFNFEGAIRGLRNPMNSWDKSDSFFCDDRDNCVDCPVNNVSEIFGCYRPDYTEYVIGKNDLNLMRTLYNAGSEHRKYLRQIFVSMDIIAPLYWWKEFDTYKIGTTADSCSTMHKIHAKEFELDDFSHEHLSNNSENDCNIEILATVVQALNRARERYNTSKQKTDWWQMIQLLPSSYNQRRTITMNYENVVTIIRQRTGHKLDEWNDFVKILKSLPYVQEIMKIMN